MKKKVDWEEEKQSEREDYSDEESVEEEPRIKDVWDNHSQAVSRKHASDLLYSMVTFKDIIVWTPRGQLLGHQRLFPVAKISERVEYVLLPQNSDEAKPRALNAFLDGLAELGVDKRLIKNKKILSDLLKKEEEYQDNEHSENNKEPSTDSEEDEETVYEKSQSHKRLKTVIRKRKAR